MLKKLLIPELMFSPIESKYGIKLASFNFYTVDEAPSCYVERANPFKYSYTNLSRSCLGRIRFLTNRHTSGTGDTAITVMQKDSNLMVLLLLVLLKMVSVIVKKIVNIALFLILLLLVLLKIYLI